MANGNTGLLGLLGNLGTLGNDPTLGLLGNFMNVGYASPGGDVAETPEQAARANAAWGGPAVKPPLAFDVTTQGQPSAAAAPSPAAPARAPAVPFVGASPVAKGKMTPDQVPPELLDALEQQESGGNRFARGQAGELGPYQFTAGTGAKYGLLRPEDFTDRDKSRAAAANYLSDLYNQSGDWHSAIGGYNAGVADPSKWTTFTRETYVPQVLGRWARLATSGAPQPPGATAKLTPQQGGLAVQAPAPEPAPPATAAVAPTDTAAPSAPTAPQTPATTPAGGTATQPPPRPQALLGPLDGGPQQLQPGQGLLGGTLGRMFADPGTQGLLAASTAMTTPTRLPQGLMQSVTGALGAGGEVARQVQTENLKNAYQLVQTTGMSLDNAMKVINVQRSAQMWDMQRNYIMSNPRLAAMFGLPYTGQAAPAPPAPGAPAQGAVPPVQGGATVPSTPAQPPAGVSVSDHATNLQNAQTVGILRDFAPLTALMDPEKGGQLQKTLQELSQPVPMRGTKFIYFPTTGEYKYFPEPPEGFSYADPQNPSAGFKAIPGALAQIAETKGAVRTAEETVNSTLRQAGETSKWFDPKTGIERTGRYVDNPNTPQEFKDRYNKILGVGGYTGQPAAEPAPAPAAGGSIGPPPETATKYLDTLRTQASDADARLANMAETKVALANFRTGPQAGKLSWVAGLANAIVPYLPQDVRDLKGMDDIIKNVNNYSADADQLNKLFTQYAMSQARGMGAREPQQIVMSFLQTNPNLATNPQALHKMLSYLQAGQEYVKLKYSNAVRWQTGDMPHQNGQPNYNMDQYEMRVQSDPMTRAQDWIPKRAAQIEREWTNLGGQ